ncbi:Clathrin light chain [Coemansia sp. Benny D115]|nr:Clathrin light chain [Coemansia sp. Benny D115]
MADEYDPLAEFLANERAALGADADMFQAADMGAASTPSMSTVPSMGAAPAMEVEESEMEVDHIPAAQSIGSPGAHSMGSPAAQPTAQLGNLSISSPPATEFQQSWQVQQQETIQARDRSSAERHQEIIASAKETVDKFYAEYNETKDRAIAENRAGQEIEMQAASRGNLWERVVKQIDLATRANDQQRQGSPFANNSNGSPSQGQGQGQGRSLAAPGAAVSTRDTSRMRELLQDLKRDPEAPGVRAKKSGTAAASA